VDSEGRVVDFIEKPKEPQSSLISMGVYIFNRDVLFNRLEEDADDSASVHDFGRSILPMMVRRDKVYAYPFNDYWRDVGTVRSYWEANMDLLARPPAFNLYDEWTIFTRSEERAPAILGERAQVVNSMVSHGCIIDGRVEHSILSPGVRVAEGATVKDSIIMTDSVIGRNAIVDYCIIDKGVVVEEGCCLGCGNDCPPNFQEPSRLNSGLTVVGKGAHIPAGTKVGRNCKLCPRVRPEDFAGDFVESGATVEMRKARSRQRRVLEKAGGGA
jgi:glucose-1-phosphate adenylyltransferase